jgi:hypothetical protein
MVDLEGEAAIGLGELTVFTAVPGALPDELDKVVVHRKKKAPL